jgi:AraC-like DNA-binding protein
MSGAGNGEKGPGSDRRPPERHVVVKSRHPLDTSTAGPVTEVATAVGYSRPAAFTHMFRSNLGSLPSAHQHRRRA